MAITLCFILSVLILLYSLRKLLNREVEQTGGHNRDAYQVLETQPRAGDYFIEHLDFPQKGFPSAKPERIQEPLEEDYFRFSDPPKKPELSRELKKKIVEHQPSVLGDEPVINWSGTQSYYWDYRYPERPVSTEFLKDYRSYCSKYPSTYPCPDVHLLIGSE